MARIRRTRSSKAREWLGRYLPPEAAGTSAALVTVAVAAGAGAGSAAVAAACAETFGFYAFVTARELRGRQAGRLLGAPAVGAAVRNVVAEFGVAEAADTVVLRPLLMYSFVAPLGGLVQGVVAGKLAADVVFYALAIAAYELRGRRRT